MGSHDKDAGIAASVFGFVVSSAVCVCYGQLVKRCIRSRIQTFLDAWVQGGTLPCAQLAIYRGDKELFYGSAGGVSRSSIFRIYSMTKPVTVVAALILVDRGLMNLDDPVSKWIPSFANMTVYVSGDETNPVTEPASRDVTIRDLMTHTSGLTYSIFGGTPVDKIIRNKIGDDWKNWFRNTPLKVLCDALGSSPLSFQPGTRWLYGFNTDVLGRVIEVVSGKSLDAFFKEEIFQPLGMRDTGFSVPPENADRLVNCFEFTGTASVTGFVPSTAEERDRLAMPTLLSGGGGLVSTIDDYAAFAKCLLRGGTYPVHPECRFSTTTARLISAKSLTLMRSNHLPGGGTLRELAMDGFSEVAGDGVGFGLGVSVLLDPTSASGGSLSGVGEYGWGGVASTWFCVDPAKDLCAVFFTQVIPSTRIQLRSHLRWLVHWAGNEIK